MKTRFTGKPRYKSLVHLAHTHAMSTPPTVQTNSFTAAKPFPIMHSPANANAVERALSNMLGDWIQWVSSASEIICFMQLLSKMTVTTAKSEVDKRIRTAQNLFNAIIDAGSCVSNAAWVAQTTTKLAKLSKGEINDISLRFLAWFDDVNKRLQSGFTWINNAQIKSHTHAPGSYWSVGTPNDHLDVPESPRGKMIAALSMHRNVEAPSW